MGRGGGCGRWDGAGERKLMVAQECGEKTRLDFGGLKLFLGLRSTKTAICQLVVKHLDPFEFR